MTPRTPATCQHELRPGTKVCLHCRRAEREAKAARQREVLTRVGLTAAAIGAVAWAGLAGFRAWQGQGSPSLGSLLASPASLEAAPVRMLTVAAPTGTSTTSLAANPATGTISGDSAAAIPDSMHRANGPAAAAGSLIHPAAPGQSDSLATTTPSAPASQPVAQPVAPIVPPAPPAPPLLPVIAEGRTELQNGMYAVRNGDTVVVHFDTPEARTRRPEKFEQIVRATLPVVHGAAAASLLAGIATDNLVGPGETITEPGSTRISLRGADGSSLSVVPQTRPGRDGPLVVAYRVTPAR